jgi:tetratricopeptide (TPR) repeat protein
MRLFRRHRRNADSDRVAEERWHSSFHVPSRRFLKERLPAYEAYRREGAFVLKLKKRDLFAWVVSRLHRYRDFFVEAKVSFSPSNRHSALGFVLRWVDDDNFYYFLVSNRQLFRFDLVFNGNPSSLIKWTPCGLVKERHSVIRIIARGSHFSFYIDDEWIAEIEDDAISEGRVGFAAQNYGESPTAQFFYHDINVESRPVFLERSFLRWARHIPAERKNRISLARGFFDSGQFAAAAVQLKKALKEGKGSAEEYSLLSESLLRLGLHREALAVVDELLGREPTRLEALLERANLLYLMGKLAEAEAFLEVHISSLDGYPAAWNLLGNIRHAQGKGGQSEASYKKAVELAPDAPIFRMNLGKALEGNGEEKEALRNYLSAARSFFQQEDYGELPAVFARIRRLGPNSKELLALEGKAAFYQGRREEAEIHFRTLIQAGCDDSAVFFLHGLLLSESGDREGALSSLEEACHLEPGFPYYWFRRAEILFILGREPEEELEEAYRLAPDDPWINNLYGQYLVRRGELTRAEGFFRRALEKSGEEGSAAEPPLAEGIRTSDSAAMNVNVDIVLNYSDCLSKQRGKEAQALELVQSALHGNDDEPRLLNQLGNFLSLRDDYSGALNAYEKALEKDPTNPNYLKNCAGLCIDRDMVLRAEELLDRLLDEETSAETYRLVANLAMVKGEHQRAELALRMAIELEPESLELKASQATFYLGRENYELARQLIEEILQMEPENSRALGLQEKMRAKFEEALTCRSCHRIWWVPKQLPQQPPLRIYGEPPEECPAGSCPECGSIFCVSCAKAHLSEGRFMCADCQIPLKLREDALRYLVRACIAESSADSEAPGRELEAEDNHREGSA